MNITFARLKGSCKWVAAIMLLCLSNNHATCAQSVVEGRAQIKALSPELQAQLQEKINAANQVLSAKVPAKTKHGIPLNFPIPVYPSNVLTSNFIHTTHGPARAKATIVTTDPPNTAINWYQATCIKDNWVVRLPNAKAQSKLQKNGPDYMLNARKGQQEVVIECIKTKNEQETLISINWILKPKQ
jgi:hypothetical protein